LAYVQVDVEQRSSLKGQPIRFQHIGLTAKTSIQALQKLSTLRDLRQAITDLDSDIESLRASINNAPSQGDGSQGKAQTRAAGKYDDIEDTSRLERLLMAREKTKTVLEGKVGWATVERARAEDPAGAA
jgi:hypothetical protein